MATTKDIINAIETTIMADVALKSWVPTLPFGSGKLHMFSGRQEPSPGTNQKPAVWIRDDPAWEFLERELNTNDRPIKQIIDLICFMPEMKPEKLQEYANEFAEHIIRIINANDTLGGIIFDITPVAAYEREGSEPFEEFVIECETQRE